MLASQWVDIKQFHVLPRPPLSFPATMFQWVEIESFPKIKRLKFSFAKTKRPFFSERTIASQYGWRTCYDQPFHCQHFEYNYSFEGFRLVSSSNICCPSMQYPCSRAIVIWVRWFANSTHRLCVSHCTMCTLLDLTHNINMLMCDWLKSTLTASTPLIRRYKFQPPSIFKCINRTIKNADNQIPYWTSGHRRGTLAPTWQVPQLMHTPYNVGGGLFLRHT